METVEREIDWRCSERERLETVERERERLETIERERDRRA